MLVYLVTITLKTSIHKLLLDIQVQPQANIERVQNEIPRNFRTYVLLYIAAYIYTDYALSSALLSSGKALSSGQNPASRQFSFCKISQ